MKHGDKVRFIIADDIVGMITGVQLLKDASRMYRVAWFHNGDYKDTWVYEFEIEAI